ncbi:MAG: helix-hairpin-helix domain-containing protein [Lachnospiraceae bacterium]|jgi:general secretion pathway protein K
MKLSSYEKKRIVYIAAAVIFILVCGIIYFGNEKKNEPSYEPVVESTVCETSFPYTDEGTGNSSYDESVVVYVTGAVLHPGVYEVGGNMRVSDAIEAAGGFKNNAAADYLNLAAQLSDGEKITVPTKKEAKALNKDDDSDESHLVNINTAAKEELMTLPGIGESKADAIIAYRQENGGYRNIEELMQISGIKEGVYSKISEYITVN